MKNLKEHWSMSKYGDSKFADKEKSPLMFILEVKEVAFAIDFIGWTLALVLWGSFGYSFWTGLAIGAAVHLSIVLCLATTSTILERRWRRKLEARKAFRQTLNRLALNKERREDARKVGF